MVFPLIWKGRYHVQIQQNITLTLRGLLRGDQVVEVLQLLFLVMWKVAKQANLIRRIILEFPIVFRQFLIGLE